MYKMFSVNQKNMNSFIRRTEKKERKKDIEMHRFLHTVGEKTQIKLMPILTKFPLLSAREISKKNI